MDRKSLLIPFFLHNVLIVALVIVSDFITSAKFFWTGDLDWGLCTLGLVLLPWVAKILTNFGPYLINNAHKFFYFCSGKPLGYFDPLFKGKGHYRYFYSKKLVDLIWSFPTFLPIR